MSTASLVRCETYESRMLESSVRHAIDLLGGMSRFVKPGDRVLLKPNLLAAHQPERCVTTDPRLVHAVCKLVLEAGGRPCIGDSPALDHFNRVAEKTDMAKVGKKLGVALIELSDPTPASLPPHAVFKKLEVASQALTADVVINLPKLKTHSQMLLTGAVKNLFGTVVAQRKAEWHYMAGVDRDTFASLHLDIYMAVKPALNIMDGVWGMEGYGPSNGIPRHLKLIAATSDAVALDVGICHLLGIPLRLLPLYRAAHVRGIGETDVRKIAFKGDSPQGLAIRDFQIPVLDSLGVLPSTVGWFFKRFLVSKPIHDGYSCTGCGQCAQICPTHAIQVKDGVATIDYTDCIRCYCCQEICPSDAIHFRRGQLVRLLSLFNR